MLSMSLAESTVVRLSRIGPFFFAHASAYAFDRASQASLTAGVVGT